MSVFDKHIFRASKVNNLCVFVDSSSRRCGLLEGDPIHRQTARAYYTIPLIEKLEVRIKDLEDKEHFMRSPKNPGGMPESILLGRVQGQIGEAKYWLAEVKKNGV